MDIGIGLPAHIPGTSGALIVDWAKKAEAGPFFTVGALDRLVYGNYEPLTALTAAAAVTQRVRLLTAVLLAPLRNGGILAKHAASVDAISGGRLTLGLAVGGREDDYAAAPASFRTRGRRFEEQLALMKRVWAGEPAGDGIGVIGPAPVQKGGPPVLIGGSAPAAMARVGKFADGYVGSGDPQRIKLSFQAAQDSWQAAGRAGKPRLVALSYFALGPGNVERGEAYLEGYYRVKRPLAPTPEALTARIETIEELGADEMVLFPAVAELDQVDRLADLIS